MGYKDVYAGFGSITRPPNLKKGSVSIVKDPNEQNTVASDNVDSHTKTNCLRLHHAELDANNQPVRPDEFINTEDEPDHQALCDREQAIARMRAENPDLPEIEYIDADLPARIDDRGIRGVEHVPRARLFDRRRADRYGHRRSDRPSRCELRLVIRALERWSLILYGDESHTLRCQEVRTGRRH